MGTACRFRIDRTISRPRAGVAPGPRSHPAPQSATPASDSTDSPTHTARPAGQPSAPTGASAAYVVGGYSATNHFSSRGRSVPPPSAFHPS